MSKPSSFKAYLNEIGASTCLFMISSKFTSAKNGCFRISSPSLAHPNLYLGLILNNPFNKDLASVESS